MKSGFIVVLFAMGTLICTTYAAPASSEIQEKDNQQKMKELLDLINQAAKSRQEDGDGDKESVEAQRFSITSFLHKHRNGIMKGLVRFVGGALSDNGGQGLATKAQNSHIQEDDDLMAAIESLPEEAQAQLWGTLAQLGLPLLGRLFQKG